MPRLVSPARTRPWPTPRQLPLAASPNKAPQPMTGKRILTQVVDIHHIFLFLKFFIQAARIKKSALQSRGARVCRVAGFL